MHPASERVLFVHAHPDDESITTGATIATLVQRGAQVTVLTCTRGELGEVIPPELAALEGDGPALATRRTAELSQAMTALGVTDQRFLGEPDARWTDLPPRRYTDSGMRWGATGAEPASIIAPDSLWAADLGEVAADIATVIDSVKADIVVSYDPTGGYGHPDHIRAAEAARRAAEVMGVPFWQVEVPGTRGSVTVDTTPVFDRKRDALSAHRTQVRVVGGEFFLSSGPARQIGAPESFSLAGNRAPEPVGWKDQGFGAKAVVWVLALVIGVVVGGVSVVNNQSTVALGAWQAPVGVVVALAISAALLAGLRIVFPGRLVAGLASIGLLGMIGLLSLDGGGGSVLVPANALGYTLTYGAVAIVAVTLAWPAAGTFSRVRLERQPKVKGTTRT